MVWLAVCGEGLTDPARATSTATKAVIEGWLAKGHGLTADILPNFPNRTKHKRSDPIRRWEHFTYAITKRAGLRMAQAAKAIGAEEQAALPKPTADELMLRTAECG